MKFISKAIGAIVERFRPKMHGPLTYEETRKQWWDGKRSTDQQKERRPADVLSLQPRNHQAALRDAGRTREDGNRECRTREGYALLKLSKDCVHFDGRRFKAYLTVPSSIAHPIPTPIEPRRRKVQFSETVEISHIPSWNPFNKHEILEGAFPNSADNDASKESRFERFIEKQEIKIAREEYWIHLLGVHDQIVELRKYPLSYKGLGNTAGKSGSTTDLWGRRRSVRLSTAAAEKPTLRPYKQKRSEKKKAFADLEQEHRQARHPDKSNEKEFGSITDENGRRRSARLQKK
jgi:hypothetical protein